MCLRPRLQSDLSVLLLGLFGLKESGVLAGEDLGLFGGQSAPHVGGTETGTDENEADSAEQTECELLARHDLLPGCP